jgi:hypothetical protein
MVVKVTMRGINLIDPADDRDGRRAVVNAATNLLVP